MRNYPTLNQNDILYSAFNVRTWPEAPTTFSLLGVKNHQLVAELIGAAAGGGGSKPAENENLMRRRREAPRCSHSSSCTACRVARCCVPCSLQQVDWTPAEQSSCHLIEWRNGDTVCGSSEVRVRNEVSDE